MIALMTTEYIRDSKFQTQMHSEYGEIRSFRLKHADRVGQRAVYSNKQWRLIYTINKIKGDQ